jgi:hypothetical protein
LNEDFPAYHLCTFHSNFTLRLKKKLVGFSHYGHFSGLPSNWTKDGTTTTPTTLTTTK